MAPTSWPVQLTSFVGRERDLAAVRHLLSTARLVTLTGVGGSGKTRLAAHLAQMVREGFPDGACFVDLAPLSEPALVPYRVVDALDLRLAPDQPPLEALLNFVRSRRLLIVLDNCEHLLPACTQLAQHLLLHSDTLRILATSREPLGILGEAVYPLSGLTLPDGDPAASAAPSAVDPQSLLHYDAVHLFVERARLVAPDLPPPRMTS